MEIGIFVFIAAIIAGVAVSDRIERNSRHNAYVRELENTVIGQERALNHYRFSRLQAEIEKDRDFAESNKVSIRNGKTERSTNIIAKGMEKVND